jgi:RNAse (barnase) inhibitor barstar
MTAQTDNGGVLLRYATAPNNAICLAQDGIVDRQSILSCLQAHFSFPDYFGENFDAAYDLLLDLVDTLSAPAVWCFCTGSNAKVDNDSITSLLQLMQDVIHYGSSKGVTLQVELFIEP